MVSQVTANPPAEIANLRDNVRPIDWQDGRLRLLDQRRLPEAEDYLYADSCPDVVAAISDMVVRGAPAIGIAAAYGVVFAAAAAYAKHSGDWCKHMQPALAALAGSRPTAVNLSWALQRMTQLFADIDDDPVPVLAAAAVKLQNEDLAANYKMGALGAAVLTPGCGVLTHCNAGSLATAGFGTALGVIRYAVATARISQVYVSETRPWLQGARLTLWELLRDEIPATLVTDGSSASLMATGRIQWLIIGADRIAANGDVANKIGTYTHAVCARHHQLRVMVVAPCATIDTHLDCGAEIPIEHRAGSEVACIGDHRLAPPAAAVFNPVFDVTPAALVDVLVTERGLIWQPDTAKIRALLALS